MTHDEVEQIHRDDMAQAIRATPKASKLPTIEQVQKIHKEHQCARVNGVLVDGTTAAVIVQIHKALNPENQAKFAALPIRKMADVAWKLSSGKGR